MYTSVCVCVVYYIVCVFNLYLLNVAYCIANGIPLTAVCTHHGMYTFTDMCNAIHVQGFMLVGKGTIYMCVHCTVSVCIHVIEIVLPIVLSKLLQVEIIHVKCDSTFLLFDTFFSSTIGCECGHG